MTTVLDQRSPSDMIGDIISKGIQTNFPQGMEKGYQRGLGANSLKEAEQGISEAGGDPYKIALALAKVGIQNPEAGRVLGPLFQTALTQGERTRGQEDFGIGKDGLPTPTEQPEAKTTSTHEESSTSVLDLVPPSGNIGDPKGIGDFQLPYNEKDFAKIRQVARQKKYTPQAEEDYVNQAKEQNEIALNRRNIRVANYDQQQKQRRDTLENQAAFAKYLDEQAPEFSGNPDELELALKASEQYQDQPSFANRLSKVKEELRPYQAAKKSLSKALERPLFGHSPERMSINSQNARFMVEAGQKPQLQLMIAKGGNGENEEALLLNPLPEQFKKSLNGISQFVSPSQAVASTEPGSDAYEKAWHSASNKRFTQAKNATNFLAENITSGNYKDPGTNLLLTRKGLMDKGLTWTESAKVIQDAISQGKIKLDPQQKMDIQKLGYPPLTGDTYFDSVMNRLMFPITGKE